MKKGLPCYVKNVARFVLLGRGRSADMDMAVMKEQVYTHRSLETGGTPCHAGPHGEGPGMVRTQKSGRGQSMAQNLSWCSLGKEPAREGRYNE